MSKFYASGSTIATLINSRDNIADCRSAMDAALKAANGRTLVLPKMWGGYLPHVLKTTDGIEIVPDRAEFKKAREAAIEAARIEREARREAHLQRMGFAPVCFGDRKVVDLEQAAKKKAAAARRDARRQQLAAECQARKGRAGGGGGKKGKKAA